MRDTGDAARPDVSWPDPPAVTSLGDKQVHVWCAVLSDFIGDLAKADAVLSSVERTRSEKFRFASDREAYVIRHGIVRVILGRYLKIAPRDIEFRAGPFGKPEIENERAREPLYFNTSDSGDLALCAVTRVCPIGVDIEYMRPISDFEQIASRFFCPQETEALRALPEKSRREAFFACWTRKEAYVKATGDGVSNGLDKVKVSVHPGEEAPALIVAGEDGAEAGWHLRSASPAPGYLAALAFRCADVGVHWWKGGNFFETAKHSPG